MKGRQALTVLSVAGLALLVVLAVFAVELVRIQGQNRRNVETRFRERARIASALTDALLASIDSPATQAENLRRYGGAVSTATMKSTVAQGHLAYAAVVDARGHVLAVAPRRPGANLSSLDPAGINRAVSSGRPYALSGIVRSAAAGGAVVEMAQGIPAPGGRRILISGFAPAALGDFLHGYLSRVIVAPAGRAYVLDAAANVIGGAGPSVAADAPVPEPALPGALRSTSQGNFGADGYLVAARVANTPWRVVLTAPRSRLLASVTGAGEWVPWLLFAAFAALSVAALALLRRVLATAAGELQMANDRLQEANRSLAGANEDLAVRAEQLSRSNAELEQFASIASHDLQEPLRKVQTFAGQLASRESDRLSPQGHDYLRRMTSAAGRMQILIEDLLKFSRVSTHGRDFLSVDLEAIAREVVEDLEVSVREAGATVSIGPLPTVTADPLQMRQLLQNLISNALKFRREDVASRVRVEGRADRRWAYLTVSDNGIGFEPKYSGRIFLVFERLHGAGTYPGTGIGLALCRKIVARHGGQISADGRPGDGAVFTVRLPVREPAAQPPDAPSSDETESEEAPLVRV